jgi:8-oxo-dGTP pyrophosphatase MutT (NUDIX family)
MKIATLNPNNVIPNGECKKRNAARGIVKRDDKFLLIYIDLYDVYKFPGGGVEPGETYKDTLKREFIEETGYRITDVGNLEYKTIEIDKSMDDGYDYWMHESSYYLAEVSEEQGELQPDIEELEEAGHDIDYEKPVWVTIDEAIETNKKLLSNPKFKTFIKRELFVLEEVKRDASL